MHKRWLLVFLIVLPVIIVGKAAFETRLPLDCDEKSVFSAASGTIEFNGNFTNPSNHPLSQVLSTLSVRLFGSSKFSVRLPALFIAVALFVVLGLLSYRYLSGISVVLLYLHYLTNEDINWYFHSARGYAAMMLLTITSLFLLWIGLVKPRKNHRAGMAALIACETLALVNHIFTALVISLLLFSSLVWIWMKRKSLGEDQRAAARRVVINFLCVMPAYLFVGGLSAWYMYKFGLSTAGEPGAAAGARVHFVEGPKAILGAFMAGLGDFKSVWRYFLAALLAVLFQQCWQRIRRDDRLSFLWVFMASGSAAIVFLSFFFKPYAWSGRYLLAFCSILIIACGETVGSMKRSPVKLALIAGFGLLFVIVPLMESNPSLVTNLCEPTFSFTSLFWQGVAALKFR